MKTAEEILEPFRGKGSFANCVDFDDAIAAMEEYAAQSHWLPYPANFPGESGWYAIALLPVNHSNSGMEDKTDVSGENAWRNSFGYNIGWWHNFRWYIHREDVTDRVTHWKERDAVPDLKPADT